MLTKELRQEALKKGFHYPKVENLETPIADLLLAQTGSKRGSEKSGKPSIRITILHMYGDMISMRSPVQKI